MSKPNTQAFSYKRLSGTGSTLVFTGDCLLAGVACSAGTSPTISIYDGTSSSGAVVVSSFPLTAGQFVQLPFALSTGLYVTLGGTSPDVTLAWLA